MTKEQEPEASWQTRVAQKLARWRGAALVAIPIVFVIAAVILWQRFGDGIIARGSKQYEVGLEGFEVTPQPDWIQADVRAEVFQDAGWAQQPPSILQPELAVRVAQAFEQHTWVSKVTRVTKHHPGRVVVQLQYRRPAAMVEVDYQGTRGLLPVDEEGILLPPENFQPEEAVNYPRITVDYFGPSGSIGTPWGDERVEDGARIAGLLRDDWSALGLYRIVAVGPTDSLTQGPPTFELHSRDGSRVIWGHAPQSETADEATANQKVARLWQYVQDSGKLSGREPPVAVDLREKQDLSSRRVQRN